MGFQRAGQEPRAEQGLSPRRGHSGYVPGTGINCAHRKSFKLELATDTLVKDGPFSLLFVYLCTASYTLLWFLSYRFNIHAKKLRKGEGTQDLT